jgi:hypothetical protein
MKNEQDFNLRLAKLEGMLAFHARLHESTAGLLAHMSTLLRDSLQSCDGEGCHEPATNYRGKVGRRYLCDHCLAVELKDLMGPRLQHERSHWHDIPNVECIKVVLEYYESIKDKIPRNLL